MGPRIILSVMWLDSYHNLVFIPIWWFGLNIVRHLADPCTTQSLIKPQIISIPYQAAERFSQDLSQGEIELFSREKYLWIHCQNLGLEFTGLESWESDTVHYWCLYVLMFPQHKYIFSLTGLATSLHLYTRPTPAPEYWGSVQLELWPLTDHLCPGLSSTTCGV